MPKYQTLVRATVEIVVELDAEDSIVAGELATEHARRYISSLEGDDCVVGARLRHHAVPSSVRDITSEIRGPVEASCSGAVLHRGLLVRHNDGRSGGRIVDIRPTRFARTVEVQWPGQARTCWEFAAQLHPDVAELVKELTPEAPSGPRAA